MGGEQTEQPVPAAAQDRAAAGGRTPADRAPGDRTARGRILAAAERLFAERGFDHTSTALIAAEARVPQGLIFYHFKTKMELPGGLCHPALAIVAGSAWRAGHMHRPPAPTEIPRRRRKRQVIR